MKKSSRMLLFVMVCLSGQAVMSGADAADVTLYTEDYPPYNFADTNGQAVGEATDRVRSLMHEAGLAYEIRIMPWVRAEKLASLKPDSMIFSMAYSDARDGAYDWIAPLAQPDMRLFGRNGMAGQVTRAKIRAGEYTALCVVTDASCDILRRVGFPETSLVSASSGGASEPLMVHYGRADMFLGDMNLQPYREYMFGVAVQEMQPMLAVESDLTFYLAAGKHIDAGLRNRVRAAYERLMERGDFTVFKRPDVPAETAEK